MRGLPPLNSLRAFEAAARLLSVRQAATELCVTPAAVSKQVRFLETYLSCRLFRRTNQRIELTPSGEIYFIRIKNALNEIRQATHELRQRQDKRTLRIRSYTTFSMHWLIPRLSSFHSVHPDIEIEITTSLKWIDFDREDVDAAIRLGDGYWSGLQAYRLIPNILAPVCSPQIAAALKTPTDLCHYTLLHTLARPDDWSHWLQRFRRDDIDAHSGRHYESSVLVYQAAAQGQGIAMAQIALIAEDLKRGTLVLPFEDTLDMQSYTYYFVVPESRPEVPELEIFRQWLLTQS